MSAIWVEQPPSANADANSAAIDHRLIVRLTGIRPEIPNYRTARASRRHRCAGTSLATPNRPAALISLEPFKPLSPETIKAQRANSTGAASMCRMRLQCVETQKLYRSAAGVNSKPVADDPRDDEPEMKL
ncbi:hypothetical protein [Bradyrhizobium australiense]|uniref:Uncharacterized protein n=1 Tax=Bradyrhizobium australiense TaxID=2721161 RepID=A0A7Y4GRT6_9BRAD|nr:hypothetical protein [Bradyrhizobium australiense]NOJ40463.1 hypothetical protein [Bradyrhizobium australiense]